MEGDLGHCIRPPLGPGELILAAEAHTVAVGRSAVSPDDPLYAEVAEAAIVLVQSGVRDREILADTLLWLSICKKEKRHDELNPLTIR
jgi:hypothetical protein